MSVDELSTWFTEVGNWGRWGEDDTLGTLNYVTPEKRVQAAGTVQRGLSVSCSRAISPRQGARNGASMLHYMQSTGAEAPSEGYHPGFDWFGMDIHGVAFTHLDGHSHIFWNGKMYNNRSADVVEALHGDTTGGVDNVRDGIVTRGVLLDFPRWKDVACLEPGQQVTPEEILACAEAEGVTLESGDALVIRIGRDVPVSEDGTGVHRKFAGLAVECARLLHEREVALVCCDGVTDASTKRAGSATIHTIGLVAMGLWLIDNAHLERLAEMCSEARVWQFLFVVAPLRLANATGSPVNPVAIL